MLNKKKNSSPLTEVSNDLSAPLEAQVKKDAWYRKPFIRKTSFWLVAILISMALWGFVLMSENPPREKRIDNVRVSFESGSEADLAARNLVVSDNLADILPNVSVVVETTLNNLQRFNDIRDVSEIITATVSLKQVHFAGQYTLDITATSQIGTVISVTPSTIVINIDSLATRSIPIDYAFSGELPEGYWHDLPILSMDAISITGARTDIQRAVKAICVIGLNNRTDSIYESFELELYDINNNLLTDLTSIGILPSVTVRMTVLPTLNLQIKPEIVGEDMLGDLFEIVSVDVSPADGLLIACDADLIDDIADNAYFEPINIGNYREEGSYVFDRTVLGIPDGTVILSENAFTVRVEIREKVETVTFTSVPVAAINTNTNDYAYAYDTLVCTVTFSGRASYIRNLLQKHIILTLDLGGYLDGPHVLTPECELLLSDDAKLNIEIVSISVISVTISKK